MLQDQEKQKVIMDHVIDVAKTIYAHELRKGTVLRSYTAEERSAMHCPTEENEQLLKEMLKANIMLAKDHGIALRKCDAVISCWLEETKKKTEED